MVDPVIAAVVGALVTVVGLFYRDLLAQRAKCESESRFWRDRYFGALAKAEIGAEQAAGDSA